MRALRAVANFSISSAMERFAKRVVVQRAEWGKTMRSSR
jgi:hypothetical protein